MEVLEANRNRHTTTVCGPRVPPRDAIEQVLEAAVWAPNHHMTEPWEFIVVSGDSLQRMADLRGEAIAETLGQATEAIRAQKSEEARQKVLAAPVSVVVTVRQDENPIRREEDFAATSAAIQNMLLAAEAVGLAAYWGTGILTSYQPFYDYLGLESGQKILGLIQLGYGNEARPRKRAPASSKTRWLD
jgi:nitroreductase